VEYVICFLKGLNDSYTTLKTQILLLEPLPNMNKVYSLNMQQERQNNGAAGTSSESKILLNTSERHFKSQEQNGWKGQGRGSSSGPRSHGRGRGRNPNYGKQCSYCHKMNHTVEECYSKHGYPPWFKQKNEYSNTLQENKNQDKREQEVCNLNTREEHVDKQNMKDDVLKGLTSEQMQKLLKLINDSDESGHSVNQIHKHTNPTDKIPQGKNLWILDTGATDHVVQNKENFTTYYRIKPVYIKLPNNSSVTANFAGTVQFSKQLILFNVLYVPEFSFNLISVQTLIKDLNCNLIFSSKCCQI